MPDFGHSEDMLNGRQEKDSDTNDLERRLSRNSTTSTSTVSSTRKRKTELTPTTPTLSNRKNHVNTAEATEARYNFIKSELKSEIHEAKMATYGSGDTKLVSILTTIIKVVNKLDPDAALSLPMKKKQKGSSETSQEIPKVKQMVDSSTCMDLTPSWWDSQMTRDSEDRTNKFKTPKVKTVVKSTANTDVESAMETEGETWSQAVTKSRKKLPKKPPVKKRLGDQSMQQTNTPKEAITQTAQPKKPGLHNRPPAILVKNLTGSSYANTVRLVRKESGLSMVDVGSTLSSMRKTREGHLLMKFKKGAVSETVA